MKIPMVVELTRSDGPRQTREVVADMLEDELPDTLWLDSTEYKITWKVAP